MAVTAIARNVRISPRKISQVAALVRGRLVDDATTILDHTPRRSAIAVKKAILSAKANATYNHNYLGQNLHIVEISVTPGRKLKRYRPAAHGRALPFVRPSAHIRVVIDGQQRPEKPTAIETKNKRQERKA